MMFKPLRPKLVYVIGLFKNVVCTSKRAPHFITKINWIMLFKEVTSVYSENHKIRKCSNLYIVTYF
jgi:hypothetical protein